MENIEPKSKKSSQKSKSTSALPKNQPRSKKDNYKFMSKSSLFQDVRSTANSGRSMIENVKQKLSSFSNILRPMKSTKEQNDTRYGTLNEQPTPVKMYSPFTFESPMPSKLTISEEERKKLRTQLFNTPTQKTAEDIENLGTGMDDLWKLTSQIESSYNSTQSSSVSNSNIGDVPGLFSDDTSLL